MHVLWSVNMIAVIDCKDMFIMYHQVLFVASAFKYLLNATDTDRYVYKSLLHSHLLL